ncbi:protein adenylyltransferase Fic [Enterococcus italicus]|uniref:protein adenylyltransferase n=1 Tax=Enterococcus italicus (strain DSM 15952 / CCUG 50447 / LMG 22039 / TP 1.5) TaxID=888064 RepID=E6LDI1_ENTI1|nr:Fic family protein [Enterococcus italicus]EFU74757.1 Fic family protein [Enterococcus italicus DSM 15952]OJG60729.1 cell division protein Fic [Enterococcus italicus DSM 15952]HCS29890.1 cell filamentation protein Fic [Enterococcus sp.]
MAVLENLLGIDNQAELAKAEEKLSKVRAKELVEVGMIDAFEIGTFKGLSQIHGYLFQDIYPFAGQIRTVDLAKGQFRFAPIVYLKQALSQIEKMPQKEYDDIIGKYVEMNVAHPFREGNGRATRIWFDQILKANLQKVVDWNLVDKDEYLTAMILSPVSDLQIKELLKGALTDKINDHEMFFKGIDASYYYEGYTEFKTSDL